MIVLLPIFAIIGIFIKLDSKGPVFFYSGEGWERWERWERNYDTEALANIKIIAINVLCKETYY